MAPILSFITAAGAFASTVLAVTPVEVKQQEFVISGSDQRFMIIGVDYQPGGQGAYGASNKQDPLSNGTLCLRDAALMQQLGVNTIRSYNVDPTLNHDECASIFNQVGIYMVIDVNSPLAGESLDRSNPSGTYTASYLQHIFSVVEAFKSYPNTLGFFAGNEIINDVPTAKDNPPYIRAIQRDLKNYIAKHAKRTIPVGYSAADVRDVLKDNWNYLQCDNSQDGSVDMSRSDFYGLNSYSWCGSGSSFTTAGYDVLVSMFSNTTFPIFFSEYGCNKPSPRVFDEVPTLYGPQMTVLSGGLVYEWSQEDSNYGLTDLKADGSLQLRADYMALSGQYAKLNVTLLESSNSTATSLKSPKCNKNLISKSGHSNNFNIPNPPSGAQKLIDSGIPNAPTGAIVSVTQTAVQVRVLATDGTEMKNLKINAISGANRPGANPSTTGPAASATSKGAAVIGRSIDTGLVGGAFAAAMIGVGAFAL